MYFDENAISTTLYRKKVSVVYPTVSPPSFFHIKNGLRSLPSPSAWELAGLWILITSNPLDPKGPFHSPYHSRGKRKNHLLPAKIARASTKRKKKENRADFSLSRRSECRNYIPRGNRFFVFFSYFFRLLYLCGIQELVSPPFFPTNCSCTVHLRRCRTNEIHCTIPSSPSFFSALSFPSATGKKI